MNMQRKSARLYWGLLVTAIFLFVVFSASEGLAAKKKYGSWKGVAADMALEFDAAREDIEADRYRDAYKHVNDAYFGYYEVQGFEKNVMVAISSARVSHIEALFSSIKHALLGNQEVAKGALLDMLESLRVKVYKDAMVLDGDIDAGEPDSVGEAVYGDKGRPAPSGGAVAAASVDTAAAVAETTAPAPAPKAPAKAPVNRDWLTFLTAFGLLVREGLEAILVIVAIVAYLIKTGNARMVRSVYVGSV
ncbi:MAG: FTR1 family protein, partial [Fretibacterium sp.]